MADVTLVISGWPGQAVVRSHTPKFAPLFHSTGAFAITAPPDVPEVVAMTWLVRHGPARTRLSLPMSPSCGQR